MQSNDEPNYETLLNQKLLAHGFLPEKGNSWVSKGKTQWADVYWDDDKPAVWLTLYRSSDDEQICSNFVKLDKCDEETLERLINAFDVN